MEVIYFISVLGLGFKKKPNNPIKKAVVHIQIQLWLFQSRFPFLASTTKVLWIQKNSQLLQNGDLPD